MIVKRLSYSFYNFVVMHNFYQTLLDNLTIERKCISMTTIERIIKLLEDRGIEQQQFASAIGVGKQKISEWKSGKTKSYMKYIDKIADYLSVSTDYLLGNNESDITEENANNNHHNDSNFSNSEKAESLNKDTKELIELIKDLPLIERSRIIVMIDDIKKNIEKQES